MFDNRFEYTLSSIAFDGVQYDCYLLRASLLRSNVVTYSRIDNAVLQLLLENSSGSSEDWQIMSCDVCNARKPGKFVYCIAISLTANYYHVIQLLK